MSNAECLFDVTGWSGAAGRNTKAPAADYYQCYITRDQGKITRKSYQEIHTVPNSCALHFRSLFNLQSEWKEILMYVKRVFRFLPSFQVSFSLKKWTRINILKLLKYSFPIIIPSFLKISADAPDKEERATRFLEEHKEAFEVIQNRINAILWRYGLYILNCLFNRLTKMKNVFG